MKLRILISILCLALAMRGIAGPPVEEGKAIFTTRCASCHNVNKMIVGPALAGVDQRHSIDWIISFVHSSQTVIKSGDPAATALFAKFNNIPMPDHRDLTADNIKSVVEYIKSQATTGTDTKTFRPEKIHPGYVPISITDYWFFISFLAIVFILIGSLLLFVRTKEYQRARADEK
jgi:cytochrome c551/c552